MSEVGHRGFQGIFFNKSQHGSNVMSEARHQWRRIDTPDAQAATTPVKRVLVLRSCRAAEFAAAVKTARARHPEAQILALTHPGHRDALRAAGVDRIVEMTGHRFGLLRLSPWTLERLRAHWYDEVVIPQMSAYAGGHVNLYRVVSALRCRAVLILAGETMKAFEHEAFFRYTLRQTFSGLLPRAVRRRLLTPVAEPG